MCLVVCVIGLSGCLVASADTVTDETSLITQALNRYSRLELYTVNDIEETRWTITSDSRVGMFELGDTQNQYLDIFKTNSDGLTEYQEIGTWVNTYPKTSTNYAFPTIRQGFLSDWLTSNTYDYNIVELYYDEMMYLPNSYHFDTVSVRGVAGSNSVAVVTIQGNILTHNSTTGENVVTPFFKTEITDNISTAQQVFVWESDDIKDYIPNYSGGLYKLIDVRVSVTLRDSIDHLSVSSGFVSEEEYRVYKEMVEVIYNSGSDIKSFDFSWLLKAVEAFLAFELLPGFKLWHILIGISGYAMLHLFMKMFAGG